MKTRLKDVEQFEEWFKNLSNQIKFREINKALEFQRTGALYANTDDELRGIIQNKFGTDVLEVYRKAHHICEFGEQLIYVDNFNDRIIGIDWEDIDEVIDEISGGWYALAEQMDIIFEE